MPTLSSQYGYVTLADGTRIDPISVDVKVSETWAPYCQATVVVPKGAIALSAIDPRQGDRLRLTLQQDFGDLIYMREVTADYSGSVSAITSGIVPSEVSLFTRKYTKPWNIFEAALPISTVTTAYTPVTPLKLTNAGLSDVWRMSDFLNDSPTWNPAPSTVFDGNLGVRAIVEDFVSQTVEISLASDEALAQDKYSLGIAANGSYSSLRAAVTNLLGNLGLGDEPSVTLEGGSDYTLTTPFVVNNANLETLSWNLWDTLENLVNSAGFTLWCDETRTWHLEPTTITSGALELKDDDNITSFTRTISREGNWFNVVNIRYAADWDQAFDYEGNPWSSVKYLYLDRKETATTSPDAASTIVARTVTRGETYEVEAISNYDARPRQTLTVDVTDIPLVSGVVQSITWSLPSARMSLELRDLTEV